MEVEEEVVVELLPLFSSPAHIATSPQAHLLDLQPTLNQRRVTVSLLERW
jgi:hypothetical protein